MRWCVTRSLRQLAKKAKVSEKDSGAIGKESDVTTGEKEVGDMDEDVMRQIFLASGDWSDDLRRDCT